MILINVVTDLEGDLAVLQGIEVIDMVILAEQKVLITGDLDFHGVFMDIFIEPGKKSMNLFNKIQSWVNYLKIAIGSYRHILKN